jgi:hypothetical protein
LVHRACHCAANLFGEEIDGHAKSIDRSSPSFAPRRNAQHRGGFVFIAAACHAKPAGANLSGKFSGTIHDPSGTGVRNATVILTDHKSNAAV